MLESRFGLALLLCAMLGSVVAAAFTRPVLSLGPLAMVVAIVIGLRRLRRSRHDSSARRDEHLASLIWLGQQVDAAYEEWAARHAVVGLHQLERWRRTHS